MLRGNVYRKAGIRVDGILMIMKRLNRTRPWAVVVRQMQKIDNPWHFLESGLQSNIIYGKEKPNCNEYNDRCRAKKRADIVVVHDAPIPVLFQPVRGCLRDIIGLSREVEQ